MTDGIDVLYRREGSTNLGLFRNNAETVVNASVETARLNYQLNNARYAYTKEDNGDKLQISIGATQISSFGDSSLLETLGPNGEVTFSSSGRLYLGAPGVAPRDVSAIVVNQFWLQNLQRIQIGRTFFIDGQWFVATGRSLFRVTSQ